MRDNKFQLQPANFVNTFAVGYENIGSFVQDVTSSVDKNFDDVAEEDRKSVASSKLRLLIGAAIVNEIRKAVKEETKYECSAGIAHNKILAKLTCGMNKPNKQTILPIESISGLYQDLAVSKVKSLGGKLGEEVCAKLSVKTMADLLRFSEVELQNHFQGRVGSWLYLMARGIDLETVTPKFMSKSIAVSKNFRGKNEISSTHTLKFWLKELAKEIVERLEKDEADCKRLAKHLIVSFTQGAIQAGQKDVSSSRTVPLNGNSLNSYTAEQIADEAFEIIKRNTAKFMKAEGTVLMNQNIKHLGMSAGKFEDIAAPGASKNLQDLLKNHQKREITKPHFNTAQATVAETSNAPSIQSLKKFEMKSPKPLTKASPASEKAEVRELLEETSTGSSEVSTDASLSESLKTSEFFDGDHSIQGMKTLRHWIAQLLMKLCFKLKADCENHQRAPSEIVIKFKQKVKQKKEEKVFNIPLASFADGLIDVDVIVELLLRSEGVLSTDETKRIQHPIVYLELAPTAFDPGKKWFYAIKDMSPVLQQNEPPSEVGREVIDDSEQANESEVADEKEELQQLSDEEFLLNELNEISKEKSSEEFTEKIPTDFDDESRDYDIDKSSEDAEVNNSPAAEINEARNGQNDTMPTEAAGPSYLNTYAEFQPQNVALEILNPKEPCTECGKMIGKLEMISHLDHHMAFRIATQQREEYRTRNKSSPSTSSQSSAKKKTAKTKPKPTLNSIQKYAFKKNESLVEEPDDNKLKCQLCQKHVATEEYVCHMDYHYAQKVREDEMKKNAPPKVDLKRKRPGSTQKNLPKMKSMKSYFTTN